MPRRKGITLTIWKLICEPPIDRISVLVDALCVTPTNHSSKEAPCCTGDGRHGEPISTLDTNRICCRTTGMITGSHPTHPRCTHVKSTEGGTYSERTTSCTAPRWMHSVRQLRTYSISHLFTNILCEKSGANYVSANSR